MKLSCLIKALQHQAHPSLRPSDRTRVEHLHLGADPLAAGTNLPGVHQKRPSSHEALTTRQRNDRRTGSTRGFHFFDPV